MLAEYNLHWNRLQGVKFDGGKNMSGSNIGVVGQNRKSCEGAGVSVPNFLHCITVLNETNCPQLV